MRRPQTPPNIADLIPAKPQRLPEIIAACGEGSDWKHYLHWDDMRRRKPPEGLTRKEWWFGTKLLRKSQANYIALQDTNENNFYYVSSNSVQKMQRDADLMAGGQIQVPDAITNPQTRDRYYISSLMEEAITSSQLEGAAVTRQVAKEMLRTNRAPRHTHEKMILNNYATMRALEEFKNRPLTKDLIFEIHRLITEDTLDDPKSAGRLRNSDEHIHVADELTGEIAHIPPEAEQLPQRMKNLCEFANETSTNTFVHPVVRAIILHFWLAYDHPFIDGNGRTARAIFYWSMLRSGYWLFEFVSISTILHKAQAKYARAFLLTETDDNDLTHFIHYNLLVIQRGIDQLFDYVRRQTEEIHSLERKLGSLDALNRRQKELISHALRHAYENYTYLSHQESHGISRQTARTDILGLVALGLLGSGKEGRQRYFTPVEDLEAKLSGLKSR